jgi:hypothetical protein
MLQVPMHVPPQPSMSPHIPVAQNGWHTHMPVLVLQLWCAGHEAPWQVWPQPALNVVPHACIAWSAALQCVWQQAPM